MIPLLEDPQMMMTIVPADQAFSCAQALRTLYEERMNKVQDRLGLDLGIVYAPLETPIPAVMDAGRRILRRKLEAKQATVKEVATDGHCTTITFESGRRCVYDWGTKDPEKADVWFPNLLPVGGDPDTVQRRHVSKIQKGDRVWLEPSTFDFQFLESASRRFDLFYDLAGGKRRSSDWKHRPYRLDELDLFDSTLTILTRSLGLGKSDTKKHQIKALDGILEQKRQTWAKGWGDLDVAFIHWALRNVEWTTAPSSEEFTTLVAAIQRGVFADLIEILVGVEKSARLGAETESMVHA